MSCTVRWAPLSSFVRSVRRMTRTWRLNHVAISCAPPVSLPGRYEKRMKAKPFSRFIHVGTLNCWEVESNIISTCNCLLLCVPWLAFRSRRVRARDVPSAAVRLKVRSPSLSTLLTPRTTAEALVEAHWEPRVHLHPATTTMTTTDLKTPTLWWKNSPLQRWDWKSLNFISDSRFCFTERAFLLFAIFFKNCFLGPSSVFPNLSRDETLLALSFNSSRTFISSFHAAKHFYCLNIKDLWVLHSHIFYVPLRTFLCAKITLAEYLRSRFWSGRCNPPFYL